jgi:hypothetical protein
VTDESISTEHYKNKIFKHLNWLNVDQVVVANSKLFTVISKGKKILIFMFLK